MCTCAKYGSSTAKKFYMGKPGEARDAGVPASQIPGQHQALKGFLLVRKIPQASRASSVSGFLGLPGVLRPQNHNWPSVKSMQLAIASSYPVASNRKLNSVQRLIRILVLDACTTKFPCNEEDRDMQAA